MAEYSENPERGYGAVILGVILVLLALLVAWWLFMSASSPLKSETNTTIIEQPQQTEPQESPDVNVVVPPTDAPSQNSTSP